MRYIIVHNVGGNPLFLDGPPKFSHWIWMKIGQDLLILVHILHQRIKKWPILAKAELEKFSKSTKKIYFLKILQLHQKLFDCLHSSITYIVFVNKMFKFLQDNFGH